MLKREAEKNHKYSRLITVAQKQAKEKKRLQAPTFSAFIVSDFGDLSPKAQELQEWIVSAYARKCSSEGQRADGCTVADRTRAFRQRFKLDVQLAIAAGLGAMLLTAGQPFENASFQTRACMCVTMFCAQAAPFASNESLSHQNYSNYFQLCEVVVVGRGRPLPNSTDYLSMSTSFIAMKLSHRVFPWGS